MGTEVLDALKKYADTFNPVTAQNILIDTIMDCFLTVNLEKDEFIEILLEKMEDEYYKK